MAKPKVVYICSECGRQEPKWLGRCPACDSWDSFVEQAPAAKTSGRGRPSGPPPVSLTGIIGGGDDRLKTGLAEFDRVLGGGVMAGSAVLLGGDPGIGKSTLMLQVMGALAGQTGPVLYVSGEESAGQLKSRADRLGVNQPELYVLTETSVEAVIDRLAELRPRAVVVDSIQTMSVADLTALPGSLSQIREAGSRLTALAKSTGVPVFMVGHVTKSGALAGPRVIEHVVDTVLYFESGQGLNFRIVRAVKNRFGSTNEIGVFEMKSQGLVEVPNPSALFLSERPVGQPGSAVVPCLEGTRPVLVEIQALVADSPYSQPKRTSLGLDSGRVAMLGAVLERQAGLALTGRDVFVNVAGGVKVSEPAADLGLACALASSLLNRPLDPEAVFLGEVGLTGELRTVARADIRLAEAGKLGFKRAIVPPQLASQLDSSAIELVGAANLSRAVERALGGRIKPTKRG